MRGLPILAVMVAMLCAPGARANDECSTAFATWVKLSESRIRKQLAEGGQPASARGACIPTEAARQDLLRGLADARVKCGAANPPDPTTLQTRTMIGINESFVAAIALCPANAQPTVAPARPAARPRACLEVSRAAADRFLLVNRRCSGSRILAIIETRTASGETECKAHLIDEKKTVAAPSKAPPHINYECPLGQGKCTKEHLAVMFPECDW